MTYNDRKTFVVLGMHRSATSLAAKGLVKSGVYMGEKTFGGHSSNMWGQWEDLDFVHLNNNILRVAGGTWDNPPSEKRILDTKPLFDPIIKTLINIRKSDGHRFWGWKDPRTTLTIKLYLPYLCKPHFVACFREVEEVANSLVNRNDMSFDKALSLAREYNIRLLEFLCEWTKTKRSDSTWAVGTDPLRVM